MDLSVNKQSGQRTVYVVEKSTVNVLAEVGVEFNSNHTWTDIDGSADKASAKAFVHDILIEEGIVNGHYILFVPIPDNSESNSVLVCPGASSLEAVNAGCSNMEVKELGDEGVTKVTIGSTEYWRIEGVTGTGGMALIQSFDLKDVMTRLKTNTTSNHDIYFGSAYGVNDPGHSIALTMSGFDLSGLSVSDMVLSASGIELSLGATAGADIWGVNINTGSKTITLTPPTSGTAYINTNSVIRLQLLNEAVVNPAVVGMTDIYINISNSDVGGPETGMITVPIVDSDQVNITGYVNTFINFDIDTSVLGTSCSYNTCLNHSGGTAASNYTVDLGELSSSTVNKSGQSVMHSDGNTGTINHIYFDLTSNAINGVVVYLKSENGLLQGPGTSYLASVSDGNNITTNSGLYGYSMPSAWLTSSGSVYFDSNCNEADEYCGFSTGLKAFADTNGDPIDGGRFRMHLAAAASYVNNPGNYTDTLTYIAVPTY